MMKSLHLIVLGRGSLSPKATGTTYSWNINVDYIDNVKSKFTVTENLGCDKGDLLVAKLPDGQYSTAIDDLSFKPFYIGIVESYEQTKDNFVIETGNLYNLANFEFVATTKNGSNGQSHLLAILTKYFLNDNTKKSNQISITVAGEPVAFSYQPSNSPTATNLVDYLIGFFKKYGIVWEVDRLGYDDYGELTLHTVIRQRTETIQLKNNTHDFQSWNVYVTPANQSAENMIQIVDKQTKDSELPLVLSTWYINELGAVSTSRSRVRLPTKSKIYLYDTLATDKPTYESIARSELSASLYAHEISVDILESSDLIRFEDISIGMRAKIVYDRDTYPSILTGYAIDSDRAIISLKFGYTRSTIKSLLTR